MQLPEGSSGRRAGSTPMRDGAGVPGLGSWSGLASGGKWQTPVGSSKTLPEKAAPWAGSNRSAPYLQGFTHSLTRGQRGPGTDLPGQFACWIRAKGRGLGSYGDPSVAEGASDGWPQAMGRVLFFLEGGWRGSA